MPAGVVDSARLLKELAGYWMALGQQEGAHAVLRACSMTLLVITDDSEDPQVLSQTLAELNHEHPSRTIVLRLSRDLAGVDGRVVVQCWRPSGSRQQICSEQIELSAPADGHGEIDSVVLGLLVPDLPVVLFCQRPDLLSDSLLRLAHRVILDGSGASSAVAAVDAAERMVRRHRATTDLAWTRITRWREIVYHIFQGTAQCGKESAVRAITIRYAGPELPATACYFAAWLVANLGWRWDGARWRGPAGDVMLHLEATPDDETVQGVGRIRSVEILGEGIDAKVMRPPGTGVDIQVDGAKRRVLFPLLAVDQVLRDEISIFEADPAFGPMLGAARQVLASVGLGR
jgi:glucose-6-phosphate dehydrogenase assembly protein OpcA